jgi:hypothetical protein
MPAQRKPTSTCHSERSISVAKRIPPRYPRMILTIEELLAGKRVEYPRLLEVTFKKAPKARPATEKRGQLPFEPVEEDEGPF